MCKGGIATGSTYNGQQHGVLRVVHRPSWEWSHTIEHLQHTHPQWQARPCTERLRVKNKQFAYWLSEWIMVKEQLSLFSWVFSWRNAVLPGNRSQQNFSKRVGAHFMWQLCQVLFHSAQRRHGKIHTLQSPTMEARWAIKVSIVKNSKQPTVSCWTWFDLGVFQQTSQLDCSFQFKINQCQSLPGNRQVPG